MCKYTWLVNRAGDVQVYEGFVDERKMYHFFSISDAKRHKISDLYEKPEYYAKCKYWIDREYAHAFFICIGKSPQFLGTIGYTDIEISDFID